MVTFGETDLVATEGGAEFDVDVDDVIRDPFSVASAPSDMKRLATRCILLSGDSDLVCAPDVSLPLPEVPLDTDGERARISSGVSSTVGASRFRFRPGPEKKADVVMEPWDHEVWSRRQRI